MTNIRQGTALLDQKYPEWYKAIDLDTLDLADGYSCVLGQLALKYGVYDRNLHHDPFHGFHVEELGIEESEDTEPFGFFTSDSTRSGEGYKSLTQRWKRAIKRRLRRDET